MGKKGGGGAVGGARGEGGDGATASERRRKQAAQLDAMKKHRAGVAKQRRIEVVFKYGGGVGVALTVVLLGFAIALGLRETEVVARLGVDAPEALQDAFFGGQPWLMLCSDSRKALKPDGTLRETFFEAAKLLTDPEFMGGSKRKVGAAVLDCGALLPSGKSTYERLGLNESRAPVLFLAQGGDKPKQLAPGLLKKPKKKNKAKRKKGQPPPPPPPDADQGKPLAVEAKRLFIKRYAVAEIKDAKTLLTKCVERRQCAFFMGAGPAPNQVKQLAAAARGAKPLVRWAYLDVGGTGYSLNVRGELVGEEDKLGRNALRMVVFREKRFSTMPQDASRPSDKEFRAFLNEALAADAQADFPVLKKIPALTYVGGNKKSKKAQANQQQQRQATTPAAKDGKPEPTPEQKRAAQQAHEKQRRAQMDEEAKLFEPAFDMDDDDDDDEDGDGDGDGEELRLDEDDLDDDADEIDLD